MAKVYPVRPVRRTRIAATLAAPTVLAVTTAVVLAAAAATWVGGPVRAQPPAPFGAARLGEPIVVPASAIDRLIGTPAGHFYAYALHAGQWQRIALQLDERDADGAIVADGAGDGALSAGDELVLLLDEAGERAETGASPGGMTGATGRAEVRAAEPDDPEAAAYAYVFRHHAGPEDAPPRRIAWDPDELRITSAHYALGLADPDEDGFIGIEHLALADGPDLVDRLKFRGTLEFFGLPTVLTEESFADPLLAGLIGDVDFAVEPTKVGTVRAVFGTGEGASVYPRRGAMLTGLEGLEDVGGGSPLPIVLTDLRVSLDLLPAASGATYADANLTDGVPVDGQPDAVPGEPLPAYRELRTAAGRIVLLPGDAAAGAADPGSARAFYADNAAGLPDDTGDGQSWGESGVTADTIEDMLAAGFPGRFVILPAESTATGAELAAAAASPLEVVVTALDATDPPTAEPTPTSGATAIPSATAAVASGRVFLPWCGQRAQ